MKKIISKLFARLIISHLKKGAVNNESVMRILIHYTLLKMQELGKEQFEIEYSNENTKLVLLAYLESINPD